MAGQHCHDPVILLEDVHFSYPGKQVVRGLDLCVLQRDFVGIIAPNGAGKTTLLRMIIGLLKPDRGSIRLFGEPIRSFRDWRRIGYVSQRNTINALFPATVREVVMSGLYGRSKLFRSVTKQDEAKCDDALRALGIEDLHSRLVGRLSGGQQQRVLLARALVNSPDLLILDEPTVGIDAATQNSFFRMIRHMHEHHNITFLMVSHDVQMMHAYLGDVPKFSSGALKFYVKHSHDMQDCSHRDLAHTLREWRTLSEQPEPAYS